MSSSFNIRIEQRIIEIEKSLDFALVNNFVVSFGLLNGKTGIALFYAYLYQLTSENKYLNKCYSLIKEISKKAILGFRNTYNYANGFAGFGWLLHHLGQMGILEGDSVDILEDLEDCFEGKMLEDFSKGNYDFLYGGVGILCYFLEKKDINEPLVKNALDQLYRNVSKKNNRFKWQSYDLTKMSKIDSSFNCGMAHGIPSILTLYSKAFKLKIFQDKELLEGITKYLLDNKSRNDTLSLYPNVVNDDLPDNFNSRLGWCYGDLGIAISLYHCYKATNDSSQYNEALSVLEHSLNRRDLEENRIYDAGLCHGTSGIFQIFNRFYLETKNGAYLETSQFWLEKSLSFNKFRCSSAGYKAYQGIDGFTEEFGLLEGISGIGLSLISALSKDSTVNNWDKVFLIS